MHTASLIVVCHSVAALWQLSEFQLSEFLKFWFIKAKIKYFVCRSMQSNSNCYLTILKTATVLWFKIIILIFSKVFLKSVKIAKTKRAKLVIMKSEIFDSSDYFLNTGLQFDDNYMQSLGMCSFTFKLKIFCGYI